MSILYEKLMLKQHSYDAFSLNKMCHTNCLTNNMSKYMNNDSFDIL